MILYSLLVPSIRAADRKVVYLTFLRSPFPVWNGFPSVVSAPVRCVVDTHVEEDEVKRQIAGVCTLAAVAAAVAFPLTAANAAERSSRHRHSARTAADSRSRPPSRSPRPQGAQIRYTLDGSTPTAKSPLYKKPLVHRRDDQPRRGLDQGRSDLAPPRSRDTSSRPTKEPLTSFFVMSDVHTSALTEKNRGIWKSHFDTLASINPDPDLIISNGDQINDNNNNTAPDHQVREDDLRREHRPPSALDDTHDPDVRTATTTWCNADMAKYYGDWFPNASGGYYEKTIDDQTSPRDRHRALLGRAAQPGCRDASPRFPPNPSPSTPRSSSSATAPPPTRSTTEPRPPTPPSPPTSPATRRPSTSRVTRTCT